MWTDEGFADPCARGGYFDVCETGRKERKGSIVHAVEVRVAKAWKISFAEDLALVSVMGMLARSHVEVNVKLVGRV